MVMACRIYRKPTRTKRAGSSAFVHWIHLFYISQFSSASSGLTIRLGVVKLPAKPAIGFVSRFFGPCPVRPASFAPLKFFLVVNVSAKVVASVLCRAICSNWTHLFSMCVAVACVTPVPIVALLSVTLWLRWRFRTSDIFILWPGVWCWVCMPSVLLLLTSVKLMVLVINVF